MEISKQFIKINLPFFKIDKMIEMAGKLIQIKN